MMEEQNKLERLSLWSNICQQGFSYPKVEQLTVSSSLCRLLALPIFISISLKMISGYKRSSLFCPSLSDEEKKV